MEVEVTRRLREREREEEERRKKEEEQRAEASNSSLSRSPSKRGRDHSLPSGVLTPLLQKHKDLDEELRSRLQELERKLCVPCVQSPTDVNLLSASVVTRSSNWSMFSPLNQGRRPDELMLPWPERIPRSTPSLLST